MNTSLLLHPKLMPYVKALTSYEFGLQGAQAEIRNIECGSIVAKTEKRYGDRFHLRILYCFKSLTWQVLMCPNNLMEPPDFIMDDDFLSGADVNLIESKVPSLAHWQPSDPNCLLNVVLELLQLYRHFQGELLSLNRETRLSFEYKALTSCTNIPSSDFEICVSEGRVSFLFHLEIDYSQLATPVPNDKYLTLLLIDISENSKNVVSLYKRKELDEVFGNVDLPELESDMMLMEYVPIVREYLQSTVDKVVYRLNQRKMLYSCLVQVFQPAILNSDNITFRSISFLLEMNNSFYVIYVEIPLSFPDDMPDVAVASMRKHRNFSPIFITPKKFNGCRGREVDDIFRVILSFIRKQAIPQYNKLTSDLDSKSKKQIQ